MLTWILITHRWPRRSPDTSAANTTKRRLSASHIVDAERNPMVIAEVKFRQISVQVLLAGVLINALHSTFEPLKKPSIVLVWIVRSSGFTYSSCPWRTTP